MKQFLSTVVTRHTKDQEGLLSTLEAIYSCKRTVEEALKEDENGNDTVAHKQTRETLTQQNNDLEKSASRMKTEDTDSNDEDNDTEEYDIPDDKSHASLEFFDGERMYSHLSDVEEDDNVSWCGSRDECILGRYTKCTVNYNVRLRRDDWNG